MRRDFHKLLHGSQLQRPFSPFKVICFRVVDKLCRGPGVNILEDIVYFTYPFNLLDALVNLFWYLKIQRAFMTGVSRVGLAPEEKNNKISMHAYHSIHRLSAFTVELIYWHLGHPMSSDVWLLSLMMMLISRIIPGATTFENSEAPMAWRSSARMMLYSPRWM